MKCLFAWIVIVIVSVIYVGLLLLEKKRKETLKLFQLFVYIKIQSKLAT